MPQMSEARLLVVVGGESTGKSTLVGDLARELPALIVDETLRRWVDERGRVPTAAEQWDVMQIHAEREDSALAAALESHTLQDALTAVPQGSQDRASASLSVVSDGGTFMTAVYSQLYYADDSLLRASLDRYAAMAALLVWCGSAIPWVADGDQRDGPHMRDAAQLIVGAVLADAEVDWVSVDGNRASRVAGVRRRLGEGAGTAAGR